MDGSLSIATTGMMINLLEGLMQSPWGQRFIRFAGHAYLLGIPGYLSVGIWYTWKVRAAGYLVYSRLHSCHVRPTYTRWLLFALGLAPTVPFTNHPAVLAGGFVGLWLVGHQVNHLVYEYRRCRAESKEAEEAVEFDQQASE